MIVVASELYWPERTSTGKYVTQIAEGLARRHAVRVLCAQPTYSRRGQLAPRREEHNGVEVRRLLSTRLDKDRLLPRIVNALSFSVSAFLEGLGAVPRGSAVLAVTNPPLLPFVMAAVCRLKRARLVLLVHDVYPDVLVASGLARKGSVLVRAFDRAQRWLLGSAERVIVLGRDAKALVEEKHPTRGSSAAVIPHWMDEGIEPLPREGNPLIAELGLEDRFVVQYAGNMGRSHDLEAILAAARELEGEDGSSAGGAHSFGFLLVGWGAKRRAVEEAAARSALGNVHVVDPRPDDALNTLLAASDVALIAFVPGMAGVSVPSRMYNVLAAGRPIVAVADAHSELAHVVLEEDVGWVVEPGDPGALARALRVARADPEALRAMGCRARRAALEKYGFERALEGYEGVLDDVDTSVRTRRGLARPPH